MQGFPTPLKVTKPRLSLLHCQAMHATQKSPSSSGRIEPPSRTPIKTTLLRLDLFNIPYKKIRSWCLFYFMRQRIRGCDHLKPGLLLPCFSHTHSCSESVSADASSQRVFSMGYWLPPAPLLPLLGKSHFLPPLSFSSNSGRKASVVSNRCFSKPDLCPRVFCGAKKLAEELPRSKSVTGYGILIE